MDRLKQLKIAWLLDNTKLGLSQIAEYTQVSEVEVLAVKEQFRSTASYDLVKFGLLTRDEITACEQNLDRHLPKKGFKTLKSIPRKRKTNQ